MMFGFTRRQPKNGRRGRALALGISLGTGIGLAPAAWAARRWPPRPAPRVVAVREVIVRREPVVIQAVTLAQLRAELQRARLAKTGYERQIAGQYQTIRRLQAQLDARLRELREADAQRAVQLNAQFEMILQAFGLVVFAIIGALLIALSRSGSREGEGAGPIPSRPVIDWEPLQRQLGEARSALATVETRLRRLEMGMPRESG
jgi:hypothetical protein